MNPEPATMTTYPDANIRRRDRRLSRLAELLWKAGNAVAAAGDHQAARRLYRRRDRIWRFLGYID